MSDSRGEKLTIGLVADAHCGQGVWHTRYFSDSLAKLACCIDTFNQRGVDMVVNLGDAIDRLDYDPTDPAEYLSAVREVFDRFDGPRHDALGNHDVACLPKERLVAELGGVGGSTYYSFDYAGFHVVVLDSNHFEDGRDHRPDQMPDDWADTWLGERQLHWLANDLTGSSAKPTVVFCHANLDYRQVDGERDPHVVCDHADVRRILEGAEGIIAVFQGHCHGGRFQTIAGIPCITLRAMCEGPGPDNNAFAIATIYADGSIAVEGFGKQDSIDLFAS